MARHLQREIDRVKRQILSLGALVEERLGLAVRAVRGRDPEFAEKVITGDAEIDETEVEIEEDILKILALHQPVAADLRFLVAVLKINSDLERIGDLAVSLAEHARALADEPDIGIPFDFEEMADRVQHMVRNALDAMVNVDAGMARRVLGEDDRVDSMHRRSYERVEEEIEEQPRERMGPLIRTLALSRCLERAADHATNICEDVIYVAEGEIHRHATGVSEKPPGGRTSER